MDFELGIVCARCDRYAPMGAASCVECANPLALAPRVVAAEPPPPAPLPRLRVPVAEPVPAPRPAPIAPVSPASKRVGPPRPEPHAPASAVSPAVSPPVSGVRPGLAESTDHIVDEPRRPDPSSSGMRAAYGAPSSLLGQEPLVPRRGSAGAFRSALASTPESAVSSPASDNPPASRTSTPAQAPTPELIALAAAANLTLEELMDQARHFVCRSCSTPVPLGHKFCGRCGAAIPPEILGARTQFFGQLQAPGKAKLILIRGEGVEGLSYQLNAEQHVVGRNGQLVFPDDPFVSPKHANLFYRNGKLVVRDEGSFNGVFVRVRGTIEIQLGDEILAGEQLFKVDANPKQNDGPAPDGTYFYSSPKHQTLFRVTQVLQGGIPGMVVCARSQSLQIGREGADLNFPGDLYMSGSHCRIEELSGKFALTDLNSRNGTYIRLRAERELAHGDYIFIGRKLLRVEITAA